MKRRMRIDGVGLPEPGTRFAEHYDVEEHLGHGGMGAVFAAQRDGRAVAIKVLLPAVAARPDAVARFANEARAASRIDSPNVIRIEDVGEVDGRPFLVMERLSGRDLGRIVSEDGPLPIEKAVGWVLQALNGVAAAHARGIVHRDLKPSNLFCIPHDSVVVIKVLDFGISKIATMDDATSITGSASTMGSPAYMSPEQVRSTKAVDARTDIWSVGVILYELLSGARPFEGDSAGATYAAILERPLVPIRELRTDVPENLELVINRCLQRRPELRYRTVAALAAALAPFCPSGAQEATRIRAVLGDTSDHAVALTTADTASTASDTAAPTAKRRHTSGAALLALAVASVASLVVVARWQASSGSAPAATTSPPSPASELVAASPPAATASQPPPAREVVALATAPVEPSATANANADGDASTNAKAKAPNGNPSTSTSGRAVMPRPPASALPTSAPTAASEASEDHVLRYRK
jgi:serine/threonine-protein kinase